MVHRLRYFLLLLLTSFSACRPAYHVQKQSGHTYPVDKTVAADSNLLKMIQPYKQQMQQVMQEVIGYNDTILTKAQPESSLGNLLADAQLWKAKTADTSVVASVANYYGLRLAYLASGPITVGKMYELMPFDNTIVIINVPGTVMQEFCNHIAASGGWPISGMRFGIQNTQAINIEIDGRSLDRQQVYKIAVNDYLAGGGDKCSFLKPLKATPTNTFVRDALIEYVRRQQSLRVAVEKRIHYAE
jgi:2',3'-cyclic-nucleotide 2'-phosphodiesterase (5'-nucleotidase family)